MKTRFLLLLISILSGGFTTAQTQLAYQNAAVTVSQVEQRQKTVSSRPDKLFKKPSDWLKVWADKPLPVANYTAQEAAYQLYLNQNTGDWIKTYSPVPDEAKYAKNNDELPLEQRDIDNEPITPYTWKWLTLQQQTEDGATVTAWLRRPHWWIRAHDAGKTGNTVHLELTEQGISGRFTVKEIKPCLIDTRFGPVEREGEYVYRPLTGKFEHQTSNVWDYTFSNGEVIGATPSHPFYSEKRQAYIPIGEIDLGEPIRTVDNRLVSLTGKEKRNRGAETVYNLEVYRDHNFLVGKAGMLVHNYCLMGSPQSVVETFIRQNAPDINLFEGFARPNSNSGDGLIHILERHSDPSDFFPAHDKGDLFPKGTTIDQIVAGIKEVYSKGARNTDPSQAVQTFSKRIKLNGESANYKLITHQNKVVTFFKIGQ